MSEAVSEAAKSLRAFEALPFARRDVELARHTTMKAGGSSRWWIEPQSEDDLRAFLALNARVGAPLRVLGAGSNVVIAPETFEGATLHLGRGFAWHRFEGDDLIAGGAALLPRLTHLCLGQGLGNFEWACGVPGSVGGSLWGNAGARGFDGRDFAARDCAADFLSCTVWQRDGSRHELGRGDVEFGYRRSSLGPVIVTQARFRLRRLETDAVARHKEAVRALLERRRATQPANAASAGCIWKNPALPECPGAGALIDGLGLKGLEAGAARISELHGNFAVNSAPPERGAQNARDVLELVELVEKIVLEKTGIRLEREARFW